MEHPCEPGFEYKAQPPPGTVPRSVYLAKGCIPRNDGGYCCPTCSICMAALAKGRTIGLSCGHSFHESCLDQWEQNPDVSEQCPLCRQTDAQAVAPWAFEDVVIETSDVPDVWTAPPAPATASPPLTPPRRQQIPVDRSGYTISMLGGLGAAGRSGGGRLGRTLYRRFPNQGPNNVAHAYNGQPHVLGVGYNPPRSAPGFPDSRVVDGNVPPHMPAVFGMTARRFPHQVVYDMTPNFFRRGEPFGEPLTMVGRPQPMGLEIPENGPDTWVIYNQALNPAVVTYIAHMTPLGVRIYKVAVNRD
jgi:hypothetical protein